MWLADTAPMANATVSSVMQSKESIPAVREERADLTIPATVRGSLAPEPEHNAQLDHAHDAHDRYDNVACTD